MQNTPKQTSVFREVLFFALPYIASYLLQTLYGLVDLFLVGRFASVADTTAVAIGSQITHVITVLTCSLSMGSTVLVGRATGKGDRRALSRSIGNTIILFAVLSVIASAVLFAFSHAIVAALSTPPEAEGRAFSYISICFLGLPAIAAFNVTASVLRGMGDSKSPLVFVAIACAANIALDCILIGALHLGAAGAAIGTVASQLFSVIIALLHIRRRQNVLDAPLKDILKIDALTMRSLIKIGLPVVFQDGFIQLSFLVITAIANARGLVDAAAVGIVEKVISIMFLIPSSMLSTVSVITAQCMGAGLPKRAKASLRLCISLSVIAGLILSVISCLFSVNIVGIFTADNVVAFHGGQYLKSYAWDCLLAGIHFCLSGYFCAMGLSILSFAHNAASVLLVRIPLAALLSARFPDTLFPMGLSPPLGSALSVIICTIAYLILSRSARQ